MISNLSSSLLSPLRRRLAMLVFALITPLAAQAQPLRDVLGFVQKTTNAFWNAVPDEIKFYQWVAVTLPKSSGAACGDGSPYRFFVNRSPLSNNMQVFFEAGGACWTKGACEGKTALGATNPNGVPENYLALRTLIENSNPLGLGTAYASPLTARLHKDNLPVQSWDTVYLPYCTGDVHLGNNVVDYHKNGSINIDVDEKQPNKDSDVRRQHHKGMQNVRAATRWIANNMGQPNKLMVSGQSAGSFGATLNYAYIRNWLKPRDGGYLLADSGPITSAPVNLDL